MATETLAEKRVTRKETLAAGGDTQEELRPGPRAMRPRSMDHPCNLPGTRGTGSQIPALGAGHRFQQVDDHVPLDVEVFEHVQLSVTGGQTRD